MRPGTGFLLGAGRMPLESEDVSGQIIARRLSST